MEIYVQIAGAVLVLMGFILGQLGKLGPSSKPFLAVNLLGSALLAANALDGRQWGFFLLNGVWAVISLVGLVHAVIRAQTLVDSR